jgi:hypothetical protein
MVVSVSAVFVFPRAGDSDLNPVFSISKHVLLSVGGSGVPGVKWMNWSYFLRGL